MTAQLKDDVPGGESSQSGHHDTPASGLQITLWHQYKLLLSNASKAVYGYFQMQTLSRITILNKIIKEPIFIKYSMPPHYRRDAFLKSVPVV